VNEPIDLFDESTPVREGISNKYLMEHNLPYRRDDVLELDLDGDRFSNAEEFELGGTNPRDKDDHPDATHKLQLSNITTEPFIVMFASQAGGKDFSVRRMDPPGARLPREKKWPTTWVELGQSFPGKGEDLNRFKALDYAEKDVHMAASSLNKKDVGVLTVEDSTSGKKIDLIQRIKTDIPIYRATFFYDGPGGTQTFEEKEKGDTFKLDGTDIEIKLTNVSETEVEFESTAEGKNPKTLKRSL
ncbi:MAG: Amuc_1099 family pilus-like system protein, partial [Verrucomicrobiales bacterium]